MANSARLHAFWVVVAQKKKQVPKAIGHLLAFGWENPRAKLMAKYPGLEGPKLVEMYRKR